MNNSISIYLDKLRISRNLSRDKFVEGILSERQYRRYLKGESSMPNDKVASLVGRLGLDLTYVYSNFFNFETEERKIVEKIYNYIQNMDFKNANLLLTNNEIDVFRNETNEKLFHICKTIVEKELSIKPAKLSVVIMQDLIDYPDCLQHKEISFNEIIALLFISGNILSENNDDSILNFLTTMVESNSIRNSLNRLQWLPSVYFTIARSHGILGHYEKVLSIAKKGVDFCLRNEIMNSLIHLLYLKSYSNFKLNNSNECVIDVRHIFELLKLQDNENRTKHFSVLIEKHMGLNQKNI